MAGSAVEPLKRMVDQQVEELIGRSLFPDVARRVVRFELRQQVVLLGTRQFNKCLAEQGEAGLVDPLKSSAGMIRSHNATIVSASVPSKNRHVPARTGKGCRSGAAKRVAEEARRKNRRVICLAGHLGSISRTPAE